MFGFNPFSSASFSEIPVAQTGYTLNASAGSYTLTGQAATFTHTSASAYVLTASAGSYTLTGKAATLAKNSALSASAGSYSLTGKSATLLKNSALSANTGSYTLTGQDATFTYVVPGRYVLTANAGSYVYNGNDASFTYVPIPSQVTGGGIPQRKRPVIVVVEVDGKEYRIPQEQLQAFLESIQQQAEVIAEEKPVTVKKTRRKVKEVPTEPLKIVIKSAPVDVVPQINKQIALTNQILANIFADATQKYLAELDDEEVLLMLL